MTDIVNYSFLEVLYGFVPIPGIHVHFSGQAEIVLDESANEVLEVRILSVEVSVNGKPDPFVTLPPKEFAAVFYEKAEAAALQEYREKRAEIQ